MGRCTAVGEIGALLAKNVLVDGLFLPRLHGENMIIITIIMISGSSLFLEILFVAYFGVLLIGTFYLGINLIRMRDRLKMHPKIIAFMFPFFINYIMAQTLFRSVYPLFSTLFPAIIIFFMSRRLENVRIFGLTGGIACGKSTLIRLLRANLKMIDIIDCDEISRNLSKKGNAGYNLIVKLLGEKSEEFLNQLTHQIEKQKFSSFVFKNKEFRNQLTKGMGKHIMLEIGKRVLSNIWNKRYLMVIDAPILYETKVLEHICYPVIVVGCSEQEQISRLERRNGYSEEEARERIKSQMPLQAKRKKCQIYLENNAKEEDLLMGFLNKVSRYIDKKRSMLVTG